MFLPCSLIFKQITDVVTQTKSKIQTAFDLLYELPISRGHHHLHIMCSTGSCVSYILTVLKMFWKMRGDIQKMLEPLRIKLNETIILMELHKGRVSGSSYLKLWWSWPLLGLWKTSKYFNMLKKFLLRKFCRVFRPHQHSNIENALQNLLCLAFLCVSGQCSTPACNIMHKSSTMAWV